MNWKKIFLLALIFFISSLVSARVFYGRFKIIFAAQTTITSRLDFDAGTFEGTESQSKEGDLKLKASGNWNPRVFKTPKVTLTNQSAIASDGTDVYLLAGQDRYFTKYISSEDRWVTLENAPHLAYNGADLVVLGDYVYAIYGSNTKNFSRYSIMTNTWEEREDMPDLVANGSTIETDGTYIYALRGNSTSDFWKYNPTTDKWSDLNTPPAAIGSGASLVYKDGYLYTPRGASNTTFYRYNISNGIWYTMQNIPATVGSNHKSTVLGDYIYVNRDTNTNSFYRFNVGTTAWQTIANIPQLTQYVGSVAVGDTATGFVYVFRGNGYYDFWKYNPRDNTFLGLTDLPNTPNTGADLLYMDNYVYFRRGNSSNSFYRYNTAVGGTWATMANAPATFADDNRGVKAGNYLYYFRGSGGANTFYRYDPSVGVGGTWATMLSTPTALTIGAGGALAYPGSGNYIYATRGGNNRTFMRYTIGVGETWDDAVVADLPDNAEQGYGSRMTSDGTNIYYISGNGMANLYKYTIADNIWTRLGTLPFSPYYGTDISYYNNKIYVLAGNLKSDFWEYSIDDESWRLLPPIQSYGLTEIGVWNGGSIVGDGSGTFYIEAGNNNTRFFSYSVGSSNYPSNGIWTSATIDLNYVKSWSPIGIESSTLPGTSINWETRTSNDRINWEIWKAGVGTSITSTPNRYIQLRITLNSDGSQTPTLNSVVINYVGDLENPTNPNNIIGLSQQVSGIGLSSGGTYNYLAPYFNWSGSTDVDTGVAGYYVYFGIDSTAVPDINGSFRTSADYLVSDPMDQTTYYLRLKTVDEAGNKSEAMTAFIYTYNGVSPPTILSKSLTTDFELGTTDSVNISDNQIKLASKAGFWQQNRLGPLSGTISYGSGFAYSATRNKLYILRGTNSNSFYQYDLTTNIGSTLANAPGTVYYGSDLVEGPSGYLYALRGNNTNGFWRYDLAAGTWSDVLAADTPQPVYYGGSLVFDGDRYIYALKGNTDDTFMRYDTMTDSWEVLDNIDFGAPIQQLNNNVYDGADLAFDGNHEIYAIQGGSKTGFSVYNISSEKWSQLGNLPVMAGAGSQIEFDADNNAIYYSPGWGRNFFYKYSIESQSWSELAEVPYVVGAGSALKKVGDNIFLAIGGGSANIYKYSISKNAWSVPTMGLFGGFFRGSDSRNFTYGADIVKGDGDYYYLTRGNYDNLFVRYNPETGVATKMADAPGGFYSGGDLTYDSVANKIYAITNPNYRKLFVYDIATDVWSEEINDPPPADAADGGAMSFDGSKYIYWIRGIGQSFYRFDTQGVGTSKWSKLPNVPLAIGAGGDLVVKGDYIYSLRGAASTSFLRFDIGTTTWSDVAVADLPSGMTVTTDGFLVDLGGNKLMACRGNNTNTCYEYSISDNSWQLIDGTFGPYIYRGAAGASNGENRAFIIPGNGTVNTPNNGIYSYVSQGSDSAYEEDGSYISPVYDLDMVYRFANLKVGVSMPNNTDLNVYTKTSSDNVEWSDWALVSDKKIIGNDWIYKINSIPGRYLMIKLNLSSSDGIKTGVVNDYQISYYQDLDPPNNPTELSVYQNISKGTTLTSGVWNNSTTPYFEWNTGTDGDNGSGVAGYYTYFNLGSTADPAVLGTYTTAPNFSGVGLSSGQTYFFRMKTKDSANNISSEVGTTFVYKLDNTPPVNPITISVDPPGYTNTNNFNFTWSSGSDVGSSVSAYCYKVGIGGTESCIQGIGITGVSGVQAYQTGTNTFYLRVKDTANNYATDYATASFYYSSIAPGAPKNLAVGPTINSVNEFAFSWQAPDLFYGQQVGLRYYYSINEEPSSSNVNKIGLAETYLSSGPYATRKDSNTFYVVAKDEAGNIDYNNFTSVQFEAKTSAPGIPLNTDISDVSVKETNNWRLALAWESPEVSGSGIANYKVYRSGVTDANCSTDMDDFTNISSTSSESFVDTNLKQTKYYYCVTACDSTNECSAPSSTVSLTPDGKWRVAPTLLDGPSAVVKTKSATVTWTTNRTASSFVKYGKSSGDYGDEVGTSDQLTAHEIDLSGLDPGTTYYYKVLWTDEDGNTGESAEQTFSTNAAPLVSAVKVSDVSLYSAYVDFTLKNAVKAVVQYGKTTAYGNNQEITTSRAEGSYMFKIEELEEGTVYHLKIQALDEEGNIFTSDDYIFETLPVPKLSDVKTQQVKGMATATLRLLWKSNTAVSSIVTYYPVGRTEMAKDNIKLTLSKNHEVLLKDLYDDTEYVLVFKGRDSMGNSAEGITLKFKTSADMRPPVISDLRLESVVDGIGADAKAQVIVYWNTDEPASSQVEYGQGTGNDYPNKSQKDSNLTLNHSLTVPELKPSEVYHFRVVTEDKIGNVSMSYDNVVITSKETKSALDLVIENLSKSFGFVSNLSGVAK
ncbi:MAG TPA: fibronectin type III domain-containing protein [Candidatus Woesebacteria bacterium]|nr:fibronectin type III domain-containing protein [Candidatus Woesebacteria bacterium]